MNEQDNINTPNDESENLIYEIDLRCQEIDSIFERYEYELQEKGTENLSLEEYEALKQEYKELRKQKREMKKGGKETIWEAIPLWMGIYAILQIIISMYFIQAMLSIHFASFLLNLFFVSNPSNTLFAILNFVFPFLCILSSLIIFLMIKNKKAKKFFLIVFIIQIIETIVTVSLMISIVSSW